MLYKIKAHRAEQIHEGLLAASGDDQSLGAGRQYDVREHKHISRQFHHDGLCQADDLEVDDQCRSKV